MNFFCWDMLQPFKKIESHKRFRNRKSILEVNVDENCISEKMFRRYLFTFWKESVFLYFKKCFLKFFFFRGIVLSFPDSNRMPELNDRVKKTTYLLFERGSKPRRELQKLIMRNPKHYFSTVGWTRSNLIYKINHDSFDQTKKKNSFKTLETIKLKSIQFRGLMHCT